jgi:signal peptidase I
MNENVKKSLDFVSLWIKKILIFLFLDSKEENRTIEKTIKNILIALVIAIIIRSLFFEPFYIPSGSMKPGLQEGDFILVSKYDYGYTKYSLPFAIIPFNGRFFFNQNKLKRGDVVVFRMPKDPSIAYIKRLIGLPGDEIEVRNSILYINGEEVEQEYVGTFFEYETDAKPSKGYKEVINDKEFIVLDTKGWTPGDSTPVFKVPNGYYFFMGDNRDNSLDSRFAETGFVPEQNLIGRARIVFFSKNGTIFKFWKSIKYNRIFKIIK